MISQKRGSGFNIRENFKGEQQLYIPEITDYTSRDQDKVREGRAIPFDEIIKAYTLMEKGSHCRLMFITLALFGCRISELDKMKIDGFVGNKYYWKLGKNQAGSRCEIVPDWYLEEIKGYRNNKDIKFINMKLFGVLSHTFRKVFNRDIRPQLGGEWIEQVYDYTNRGWALGYKLQMKGLRKTFATHTFYRYWRKLESPSAAMEMVSKRMKHSSKGLTVTHYIEDGENLNIKKYSDREIHLILTDITQSKISEFGEN